MAVIYLKHERHGTKVACSEDEAKHDEGHGWTRYTLGRQVATSSLADQSNVSAIEPVREKRKYTRKAA